jgi:hypothetical protein
MPAPDMRTLRRGSERDILFAWAVLRMDEGYMVVEKGKRVFLDEHVLRNKVRETTVIMVALGNSDLNAMNRFADDEETRTFPLYQASEG